MAQMVHDDEVLGNPGGNEKKSSISYGRFIKNQF